MGAFVVLAALLALLHGPLLRAAGNWLCIRTPLPRKADLIYVYAGGEFERTPHAAALFHKGIAPRVMTAGELKTDKLRALGLRYTDADVNARVLMKHGVPENRIIRVNTGASTWDETRILHDYMKQRRLHSAILVTSNFHTRRVRMTACVVFRGENVRLYYEPAPRPITNLGNWWKTEEDLITVNNEYLKLLFYFMNYRLGARRQFATRHPEAEAR